MVSHDFAGGGPLRPDATLPVQFHSGFARRACGVPVIFSWSRVPYIFRLLAGIFRSCLCCASSEFIAFVPELWGIGLHGLAERGVAASVRR